MIRKLQTMLATFFYIGYLPVAPGSIATLAGIALSYAVANNPNVYILVTLLVTIVGFMVSGQAEALTGKKDPGCIVIDEVAGVMIAFYALPQTWPVMWTAFFVFRAFDMFKIYPGNKFEGMKGSAGIMLDDVIAGIYTNIVMQIVLHYV